MTRLILYMPTCLAVCLFTLGCGDPNLIKVKGKVVLDGQPIQLDQQEELDITFYSIPEGGGRPDDTLAARVSRDGTFQVLGGLKKGIPRGKYEIDIALVHGKRDNPLKAGLRQLPKPLIREVTGEEIVIDVPKPPG